MGSVSVAIGAPATTRHYITDELTQSAKGKEVLGGLPEAIPRGKVDYQTFRTTSPMNPNLGLLRSCLEELVCYSMLVSARCALCVP